MVYTICKCECECENRTFLQHGLDLVCDLEVCARLGADLVDGDAVRDFDEREALCEIDVEDTLLFPLALSLSRYSR